MNRTIEGKSNIKATVICDSVSSVNGKRITTLEIEFPRIILSEFNTHRALSRSSASSRAIPFDKMLKQLNGKPVRFGAANPGMQDKGEEYSSYVNSHSRLSSMGYSDTPQNVWRDAKEMMCFFAENFYKAGYHKQVYNRLLEPFQMMKTVVTATNWNNFFWLRLDEAADPTIQELARCMKQAMDESIPQELSPDEWHLPYVVVTRNNKWLQEFWEDNYDGHILSTDEAIKVSAARCAAVSFRNEDYGLEKCLQVYDRLVGGERKHSSALEHQATPIPDDGGGFNYSYEYPSSWPEGVTHMNKELQLCSGNFVGWIQHRQLIPNESKKG